MTAHSIYFLLLGELGVPGLALLLTFIFSNLAMNRRLLAEVRKLPEDEALTAENVLNCTNAALIAYATGGAFLSAAYYPHMYVLAALLSCSRRVVRLEIEALAHSSQDQSAAACPTIVPLSPGAISPEWVPRLHLASGASSDRSRR